MSRKKCKCPPEGAPEWVVTYGDMMTLLLCFFVLIVSMSTIKKDDPKVQAVVEEIRKTFGMHGGGGTMDTHEPPALSLIHVLETMRSEQNTKPKRSQAPDPGMEGKQAKVTRIRESKLYGVGGRLTFEPGSAKLSDRDKHQLDQIADLIRGYNNLVQIKGNASPMELSQLGSGVTVGSQGGSHGGGGAGHGSARVSPARYHDLWDLSYARAKAVMDYLTSDAIGLDPARFRIIGNGDREPIAHRQYDTQGQTPNRRVEVQVSDSVMRDVTEPES